MKFNLNNKYFRWGLTAFLVMVASISFYYVIFHVSNIKLGVDIFLNLMMPVLFALIIAYLMTPVLNHIEYYILQPLADKLKIKKSAKRQSVIRGIGIILTICLFVLVIYSLCAMMLSQIIPSIVSIVSNFDTYISNFTQWINKLLEDNPALGSYVIRLINQYSGEIENWLNDTLLTKTSEFIMTVSLSVIGVLKVLWDAILGLVIAIYLLSSKEIFTGQAKKVIYACFERTTANAFIHNLRFTHRTFIGFIGGKIIDSIIIGILCFIGTSILDIPYAALVSLVIGVTNIIPFFGPFLGGIPSVILVFVVDPLNFLNAIYLGIFILILQQFDGNVLGPKILGDSTGLSGFWVIFSITVLGGLWGVAGMIVGVPVFAIIYAAVKSIVNTSLEKKKMETLTEEYINLAYVDEEGTYHEYVPEYKRKKETRQEKKAQKHSKEFDGQEDDKE